MNVRSTLKLWIPSALHPTIRACVGFSRSILTPGRVYKERVENELNAFSAAEVHDLPEIAHYWSNKYLLPILQPYGFTNSIEMFRLHIAELCRRSPAEKLLFMSIGCGNAEPETRIAEWLLSEGITNFTLEGVDLNPDLLLRARATAEAKGLADHFIFSHVDVNKWRPARKYHGVIALQCLHHFVELERLFDKIQEVLHDDGYFMVDDMIGRNGHQRWPEALKFVNDLWNELPAKYKYNHHSGKIVEPYRDENHAAQSFEGIRAQDILPLLVNRFHFQFFVAWGNILDIFIDRCYGPNFDPRNEHDRAFIDRIHALDVAEIESGRLKPTHMYAVITKNSVAQPRYYKHLTPEFCIRRPDPKRRLMARSS